MVLVWELAEDVDVGSILVVVLETVDEVEATGGAYGARHCFLIKSRYVWPLLLFCIAKVAS